MNHSLVLSAPAKLNLFLHIIGRRQDGYHELQTLFQIIDYGDELRLTQTDDGAIHLVGDFADTPTENNLIYLAANTLRSYGDASQGVRIDVKKRLPMGGGLGGGSSDAATTLVGLNELWQLGLNEPRLLEIALRLGADVPLFVKGCSAIGEGIGERLTPIVMDSWWFLLVVPPCQVSTAGIFAHEDLTRDTSAIKIARFQTPGTVSSFLGDDYKNDCEAVARRLYPEIDALLNWFAGRAPARMTGTGSCVFAAFPTQREALENRDQLPDQWLGIVTRGVSESPLIGEIKAAKVKT